MHSDASEKGNSADELNGTPSGKGKIKGGKKKGGKGDKQARVTTEHQTGENKNKTEAVPGPRTGDKYLYLREEVRNSPGRRDVVKIVGSKRRTVHQST